MVTIHCCFQLSNINKNPNISLDPRFIKQVNLLLFPVAQNLFCHGFYLPGIQANCVLAEVLVLYNKNFLQPFLVIGNTCDISWSAGCCCRNPIPVAVILVNPIVVGIGHKPSCTHLRQDIATGKRYRPSSGRKSGRMRRTSTNCWWCASKLQNNDGIFAVCSQQQNRERPTGRSRFFCAEGDMLNDVKRINTIR